MISEKREYERQESHYELIKKIYYHSIKFRIMKTVFNFLWLWLVALSATAQSTELNFKGVFDMSVSDDKIYTATSEGLGCYNISTGSYTVEALPDSLQQHLWWHVASDGDKVYIGSYRGKVGLWASQKFEYYTTSIMPWGETHLCVTPGHELFAYDHVLTKIAKADTKTYIAYRAAISSIFHFKNALPTADGKIWLCGSDMFGGLYRFEGDTIVFVADMGDLMAIDSDSKGHLWIISSTDKLSLVEMADDKVVNRFEHEWIKAPVGSTNMIAVDDNDNVWICGTKLLKFDGKEFIAYPLPDTESVRCMRWAKGKLYLGTQDGLYVFDNGSYTPVNGSSTGIRTISEQAATTDAPCYDLQGMKISSPKAGQVYIQQGVKRVKR